MGEASPQREAGGREVARCWCSSGNDGAGRVRGLEYRPEERLKAVVAAAPATSVKG